MSKLSCLLGSHQWNGCKCTDCDKTRDKDHDWSKDCSRCQKCNAIRDESYHDWSKDCCRCYKCRAVRDESFHDWSKNCERCAKCKETRDVGHRWSKNKKYCLDCGIQHAYCKFRKLHLEGETVYQICVECGREQKWSPKVKPSNIPGRKIFVPDYSSLVLDESYIQKKDRDLDIPEDTIVLPYNHWDCPICGNHFSNCGSSGAISKFTHVPKGGAPTGGFFWWKLVEHCNRIFLISNSGNY